MEVTKLVRWAALAGGQGHAGRIGQAHRVSTARPAAFGPGCVKTQNEGLAADLYALSRILENNEAFQAA
jgi:hypothetical protein